MQFGLLYQASKGPLMTHAIVNSSQRLQAPDYVRVGAQIV